MTLKYAVGDRVIATGSKEHGTRWCKDRAGVIKSCDPLCSHIVQYHVTLDTDHNSIANWWFTEDELRPEREEPQPGDLVRVEYLKFDYVKAAEAIVEPNGTYVGRHMVSIGHVTVRILKRAEPADDPADDPTGTVREACTGHSVVKMLPTTPGTPPWMVVGTGATLFNGGVASMPVIGAVPGTAAAQAADDEAESDEPSYWLTTNGTFYRWSKARLDFWHELEYEWCMSYAHDCPENLSGAHRVDASEVPAEALRVA